MTEMGAMQPMLVHDILWQLRPCKQTMRAQRPMFQKDRYRTILHSKAPGRLHWRRS